MTDSVTFDAFVPSNIEDSCSEYSSFSLLMGAFANITDMIVPSSNMQTYVFQCDDVHDWYESLAHEETCSNTPMYLSLSLLFAFVLVLLSIIMITTNIAWKSNTQLFKDIYSEVEKGQIKALGGRSIPEMTNGGSKQKFRSHRLVIVDRTLGISDDESASYPGSISYLDHVGDDDDDDDDDDEGVDKSEKQDSSVFADALELEELELRNTSKRIIGIDNYILALRDEAVLKNEALQKRLRHQIVYEGNEFYQPEYSVREEIHPRIETPYQDVSPYSFASSGLIRTDTDEEETDDNDSDITPNKNWTWKSMLIRKFR